MFTQIAAIARNPTGPKTAEEGRKIISQQIDGIDG
jgi:hypothetical protein